VSKKTNILRSLSVLILGAIIFLFAHSELDAIKIHTDLCKDVDLCLIIDSAKIDNDGNFSEIQHILCCAAMINVLLPQVSISQKINQGFIFNHSSDNVSTKVFIKNLSFLI
jgi:hypothetical protein